MNLKIIITLSKTDMNNLATFYQKKRLKDSS